VAAPLHALHSLLQQSAVEKHLNPAFNLSGNCCMCSVHSLVLINIVGMSALAVHQNVRRAEQLRCDELLKSRKCVWLIKYCIQ